MVSEIDTDQQIPTQNEGMASQATQGAGGANQNPPEGGDASTQPQTTPAKQTKIVNQNQKIALCQYVKGEIIISFHIQYFENNV